MLKKIITFTLLILIIFSCKNDIEKAKTSINGVWESIGSGWVLEIKDSTSYQLYDITSISCLQNRKGDFKELQKSLTLEKDTLNLLTGVITYQFTKSKSLPEACR